MSAILVRPNELRQAAGQLRTQAKKISNAINLFDTAMTLLQGNQFMGNRANVLQRTYQPKRDALLRASALITEFATDLQRAADTFEHADKGQQGGTHPPPVHAPPPKTNPSPAPAPADSSTVKKIQDTIKNLKVTETSRYQPRDGKTWCNIFTMDYCKKMGVPLPEWLDFNKDGKIDDYLDANEATRWLKGTYDKGDTKEGPDMGWKTVSAEESVRLANSGKVVIAGWENPSGIGHMAVVRPESTPDNIRIAQAGAKNFENGTLAQGFGNRTPAFFVYDP